MDRLHSGLVTLSVVRIVVTRQPGRVTNRIGIKRDFMCVVPAMLGNCGLKPVLRIPQLNPKMNQEPHEVAPESGSLAAVGADGIMAKTDEVRVWVTGPTLVRVHEVAPGCVTHQDFSRAVESR